MMKIIIMRLADINTSQLMTHASKRLSVTDHCGGTGCYDGPAEHLDELNFEYMYSVEPREST